MTPNDLFAAAPELMKKWTAASVAIASSLEPALVRLVEIRASQINGCANCINMHAQEARANGETEQRVYLLSAWREAGTRGAAPRADWDKRLAAAGDRGAEFSRRTAGKLHAGFDEAIAAHKQKLAVDKPKVATRKSSEMALEVINGALADTIGGSADLTPSNNTKTSQTLEL